jgi:O-antigen ligase
MAGQLGMSSASDVAQSGTNLNSKQIEAGGMLASLACFYIVVVVGKVSDLVPGLGGVPLAKIIGGIALIVAIRSKNSAGLPKMSAIPPAKLTLLFMGLVAASIFFSVWPSETLGLIKGPVFALAIGLFVVVKASYNWSAIRRMLFGAVGASVVLVFTAMLSNLGGRAGYSKSYDPNDFAYVLVGLLPVIAAFGVLSRGAKKLSFLCIALCVVVTILLTQSRGGFLGLLFDVLMMAWIFPSVSRGQVRLAPPISTKIMRLTVLACVSVTIWQEIPDDARQRLASILTAGSDYNSTDTQDGRVAIWSRNLPLVVKRPWGYGAGSFSMVDGMFAGGRYKAPHNTYLEAVIELGIPGLLLFASVIVSCLSYLRTTSRANGPPTQRSEVESRTFGRALGIGLLALCVSGFFLSALYSNVLWLQVALICAVGAGRASQSRTNDSTLPR